MSARPTEALRIVAPAERVRTAKSTRVTAGDVREKLRRQVGDASRALRESAVSDEAIHRARKDVKRARANLRLLRGAIGKRAYGETNAALRDASRPLGSLRDAHVLLQTLARLLESENSAAQRALLLKMQNLLQQAERDARESAEGGNHVHESADALEQTWQRVEQWSLADSRAAPVQKGMRRIYRAARKALDHARSERTPESLHDWRKQVKYLGEAMRAYKPEASRAAPALERISSISDSLGDDHDLFVLQEHITRLHAASNARTALFTRIESLRGKLQSKALKDGRRLFRSKPKAFVKRLRTVA